MLDEGEIGIICEENLIVDESVSTHEVKITQVRLKDKNIPVFIVPPTFNIADLVQSIENRTGVNLSFFGVDSGSLVDRAKLSVIKALDSMVFAIETANSINEERK